MNAIGETTSTLKSTTTTITTRKIDDKREHCFVDDGNVNSNDNANCNRDENDATTTSMKTLVALVVFIGKKERAVLYEMRLGVVGLGSVSDNRFVDCEM